MTTRKLISFVCASFLILWLAATLYLLAELHRAGKLVYYTREGKPYISDFLNVYAAGKLTLSSDRYHIYDAAVQQAMVNQLISPARLERTFFLQYPPYFFLAMTPLAFLPIAGAYWLWLCVTVAMGLAALLLLVRLTGQLRGSMAWLFLLAVVASAPSWRTLRLGQVSWLLVAMTALYCHCLLRRKDVGAGILLALSSIKLQYLPFLAMPLLATRRWKVVASAFIAELFLLGASAIFFGPDNVLNYPAVILTGEISSRYIGVAQEKMVSLIGVLNVLGLNKLAGPASIVGLLVGLFVSFAVCRSAALSSAKNAAWPLALTIVIAVLTSPHVHFHDLLLLSVAAALTLQVVSPFEACQLEPRSRGLWNGIFVVYPIVSWLIFFTLDRWSGLAFFLLNAVLLGAGLAFWRADSTPSGEADANL